MDGRSSQTESDDEKISEITLRPFKLPDVDDFMVWATDEKVSHFCTWETFTSKEQAIDFIKTKVIPHPCLKAICLKNRAIGNILVTPNSGDGEGRAELGYCLASGYWGKGIMTRAVKMAVSSAFAKWPDLERIEALVEVDNLGSIRVLEKAGFKKEGLLRKYGRFKGKSRDFEMFSLLSTDLSY